VAENRPVLSLLSLCGCWEKILQTYFCFLQGAGVGDGVSVSLFPLYPGAHGYEVRPRLHYLDLLYIACHAYITLYKKNQQQIGESGK